MSPFKRYIHVERLDSDECAGLLENDGVYVTAKVDGSNGSVWWDGDAHRLACASRNNVLDLDEDNAGFGGRRMQGPRLAQRIWSPGVRQDRAR